MTKGDQVKALGFPGPRKIVNCETLLNAIVVIEWFDELLYYLIRYIVTFYNLVFLDFAIRLLGRT